MDCDTVECSEACQDRPDDRTLSLSNPPQSRVLHSVTELSTRDLAEFARNMAAQPRETLSHCTLCGIAARASVIANVDFQLLEVRSALRHAVRFERSTVILAFHADVIVQTHERH